MIKLKAYNLKKLQSLKHQILKAIEIKKNSNNIKFIFKK
jgi:hypothetical protein